MQKNTKNSFFFPNNSSDGTSNARSQGLSIYSETFFLYIGN